MERAEPRLVGDPHDAFDLGFEGIAGRRDRVPGVHLEVLRPGIDTAAELDEQGLVRRAGGQHRAREQDDRPTMLQVQVPALRRLSDRCSLVRR